MAEVLRNSDVYWNWSKEALNAYLRGNYKGEVSEFDQYLNGSAVSMLKRTPAARDRMSGHGMREHKRGLIIGMGNAMINAALMAPFVDEIHLTDVGAEKLAAMEKTVYSCRLGKLGIWQAHQEFLAGEDELWEGSFQRAAEIGSIFELDMKNLEDYEGAYDFVSAHFVVESATASSEEWEERSRALCRTARSGTGTVEVEYMEGSEGYLVGDTAYPAYPVTTEEEIMLARDELDRVQTYRTDMTSDIRQENDKHVATGGGVIVGTRKAA